jgi:hypothetical protein
MAQYDRPSGLAAVPIMGLEAEPVWVILVTVRKDLVPVAVKVPVPLPVMVSVIDFPLASVPTISQLAADASAEVSITIAAAVPAPPRCEKIRL